jgi:CheY-like chemotaxis protein
VFEPSNTREMDRRRDGPVVLLVGPSAQQAWDDVTGVEAPPRDAALLATVRTPDLLAAIAWIENQRVEPALVVIGQSWPGEIGQPELMRLRQAAPLTRVCGLFAGWCEGETRSGQPWPGAWRVFGHQWPQRGARQLAALAVGKPTVWNLPVTATAEEQLLAEIDLLARRVASRSNRPDEQRVIAVLAEAAEAGAALADAYAALGYQAVVWREPPAIGGFVAGALLWDTRADRAARADVVGRLKEAAGGAPIVAMLGFPRPEEIERAKSAGVAAVVSKPFLLADLDWQLTALLRREWPVG